MKKIMIHCPMPKTPISVSGIMIGNTQLIPIETCANMNNGGYGKECKCLNIPPERASQPDFDPKNITLNDYIISNGIDILGVSCGYPRDIYAVVMELPDPEPSKLIRV